jgi:excisionase family DNA binding protein
MPVPPAVHVSTKEAARRLGTHQATVLALLHSGELDGYAQTTAISGRVHAWKVEEASIRAYIERQRRKVPA